MNCGSTSGFYPIPGNTLKLPEKFLSREHSLKEQKKREHLLRMSGIKRVKLLSDFDWAYNPKVPREKIMEFMETDWLKRPCNLVLIGPSGVGKSHVASAICYDAVTKGRQTVFLTLFDLTAKLTKARSAYSLIDYYARIPVLCLDEVGYVMPSREHADYLFQIISKRVEIGTTIIVTTNLIPSQGHSLNSLVPAFLEDRKKSGRMEEWQLQQAELALKLYLDHFGGRNILREVACVEGNDKNLDEPAILEEMKNLIRLKHYAYGTERTYLDWAKRFFVYAAQTGKDSIGPLSDNDVKSFLGWLALKNKGIIVHAESGLQRPPVLVPRCTWEGYG